MKKIITIEYELDDIDTLILSCISEMNLTISQIRSIIRFEAKKDLSSMYITRKINDLIVLGLVARQKKNSKVYVYFSPHYNI